MFVITAGARPPEAHCLTLDKTIANSILATVNGVISVVAFVQLLRLHLYTLPLRWTRQKACVFHCLLGVATLGFCIYFVGNVIAACQGWFCWQHACGFIAMALPEILFLATFLLLLSFWVDLCHQATDREEEEEEDSEEREEEASMTSEDGTHPGKHRRCCQWWRTRVHARQKFVIGVVGLIFIITLVFAILIWIGMGHNPINSRTVAEIYSDLFAIIIFLAGGGLAGYGLALYTRMSRLRAGKASSDLQKVAGLAVVSVICFSVRALFVLLGDIDGLINRNRYEVVSFVLYSLIGEVIPCTAVLWVMRNYPSRSRSRSSKHERFIISPVDQQALAQEQALLQQWIVPTDLESLVVPPSRSKRIKSSSEGGSTSNSA